MKNVSLLTLTSLFITTSAFAELYSDIFTYDDPHNARGLHVRLEGRNWNVREVMPEDIPFHQYLFSEEDVMKNFGSFEVRKPDDTKDRLETQWLPRFEKGQPHGGMTVFEKLERYPTAKAKAGSIVSGGGDEPGVSEVAYLYQPHCWGKGIGTSVVNQIVTTWAPEVRRIGLGKGLDPLNSSDASVIKAFNCFEGQPLWRLDATASPINLGSWKVLQQTGFKAARYKVDGVDVVLDFDGQGSGRKLSELMAELEKKFLAAFDPNATSRPLETGKRYSIIDFDGKPQTISKHHKWDRAKYHYELEIGPRPE